MACRKRGRLGLEPVFDVYCKGITILFRGSKSNPVSPFTEDRECITLESIDEDRMIYHDPHNLVSYSSEEKCDNTLALLKI